VRELGKIGSTAARDPGLAPLAARNKTGKHWLMK
jgi:hypothetical protein